MNNIDFKELNLEEKNNIIEKNSNIVFKNFNFPNKEEAEEYLLDVVKKDRIVITSFEKSVEKFEDSEISKDILEKISQTKIELENYPNYLIDKIKEQKSKTKSCSNCESSINKEYLISNIEKDLEINQELSFQEKIQNILVCPICKNKEYLINETDKKKLESIENKIQTLENNLEKNKESFILKSKKETFFLLGEIQEFTEKEDLEEELFSVREDS